jgi:uncharacterized protein YbdZ (MbtH family)
MLKLQEFEEPSLPPKSNNDVSQQSDTESTGSVGHRLDHNRKKPLYEKHLIENNFKFERFDGTKMKIYCPEGHQTTHSIRNLIQQAHRKSSSLCPQCKKNAKPDLITKLGNMGFTILKEEGKLLELRCPKNHIYKELRSNTKQYLWGMESGKNWNLCRECKNEDLHESRVRNLNRAGFILIRFFVGEDNPRPERRLHVEVKCRENGHTWVGRYSSFWNEHGKHSKCPQCRMVPKGWYNHCKSNFESESLKFLERYKNSAKIELNGKEMIVNIRKLGDILGKDVFSLWGYTVIAKDFKKGARPDRNQHVVVCPDNHTFETKYRYLYDGHGCRICSMSYVNWYEDWLRSFLSSLGYKVELRNQSMLDGQEIDVYIPELRFGIEFNGTYNHSIEFREKSRKDPNIHQAKALLAREKGVYLVNLFEWDFGDMTEKDLLSLRKYLTFLLGKPDRVFGVPQIKYVRTRKVGTQQVAELVDQDTEWKFSIYDDGITYINKPSPKKKIRCEFCNQLTEKHYSSVTRSKKSKMPISCGCEKTNILVREYLNLKKSSELYITYKQFLSLKRSPCYYCSDTKSGNLDVISKDRGFTIENTVSLCSSCKLAKGDRDHTQFLEYMGRIAVNINKMKFGLLHTR